MGNLEKEIIINADLEKVWGMLADVSKMSSWVDGVRESDKTGSVFEGKGLKWIEQCEIGKQHIESENEFTVWEPMSFAVIEAKLPMGGVMKREHFLKSVDGGVQVNVKVSWNLGIAGMLLGEEKVRNILDESFSNTLANWKEKAEAK